MENVDTDGKFPVSCPSFLAISLSSPSYSFVSNCACLSVFLYFFIFMAVCIFLSLSIYSCFMDTVLVFFTLTLPAEITRSPCFHTMVLSPRLSTPHSNTTLVPYVVVVYHVAIVANGHGLLKKFWLLVLGCVLRTAGISII